MMSDKVPVIVAGFGWLARNRTVIPLLEQDQPLMKVVAVTSLRDGEKEFRTLIEPEFSSRGWEIPSFIQELSQALEGDRITTKPVAVVINTPNRLHFGEAKMALEAGLNVYVERPIACPDDDLELIIQLALRKKKLLFTGVQRRLEDTFNYLYKAVANNYYFDKLTSIRCFLSAGRQLDGWRRNPSLAGGGILVDEGYHLLDSAAWIASLSVIEIPDQLSGAVLLKNEENLSRILPPLEVETTALGYINLPTNILLSFDLSYHAPIGSIYERLEIRDDVGSMVTLTRNQTKRSTVPATITHQLANGNILESQAFGDLRIPMNEIRFSGTTNITGPLKRFLERIKEKQTNSKDIDMCDARLSLSTWRLIRNIYRLANNT